MEIARSGRGVPKLSAAIVAAAGGGGCRGASLPSLSQVDSAVHSDRPLSVCVCFARALLLQFCTSPDDWQSIPRRRRNFVNSLARRCGHRPDIAGDGRTDLGCSCFAREGPIKIWQAGRRRSLAHSLGSFWRMLRRQVQSLFVRKVWI